VKQRLRAKGKQKLPYSVGCNVKFLSLLLFLLAPLCAQAQDTTDTRSLWQTIGDDLGISGNKAVGFVTAPARWEVNDLAYLGIGLGAITGLITIDDETSRPLFHSADGFDPLANALELGRGYGERNLGILASLATYGTGLITGEPKIRRVGRLLGESLLFSAAITGSGKILFGRKRPFADKWDWNIWELDDARQSFPSGHATVAFAMSSVLAQEIDSWVVGAAAYSLAGLTAYSRVDARRHWVADVVAGAAIGTLCGLYVTSKEDEVVTASEGASENRSGASWMLTPSAGGLLFLYHF
jgi:membrane-associated phospholipid phosphatase